MNLIKIILIILGTLSLSVGLVGVLVPGLPTTPFLLLTAGLYIRSSEKLYNKLISNQIFGAYINEFQTNRGMTKRGKLYAIGIMWIMIFISCNFLIQLWHIKFLVFIIGLIGTIVMGFIIPTSTISNKKE